VDDAARVGERERLRDAPPERHRLLDRERTPREALAEILDLELPTVDMPAPRESRATTALAHLVRNLRTAQNQTDDEYLQYKIRTMFRLARHIARMDEIADELAQAEERYLPKRNESTRAIVLAASRGDELGTLTSAKPKAMVEVGGTPLLHRLVGQLRQAHIKDIVVVRGYGKAEVHAPDVRFVDAADYEGACELVSLAETLPQLEGDVVISFGDILFRKYILNNLLAEEHDLVIVADAAWRDRNGVDRYHDYVQATRPYSLEYDETPVLLARMDPLIAREQVDGEWIGLLKATARGTQAIRGSIERLRERPDFRRLRFKDLFADLVDAGHQLHVLYITGHWLDVDNLEDLNRAQTF